MPLEDFPREVIERKLKHSLDLLLKNDYYLLENDVNERSISHRLALYLQQEFDSWHVDCEYNRYYHTTKKLELPINHDITEKLDLPPCQQPDSRDTDAKTVYPDIIIHNRGTDDNLVVIEMKKTTSQVPKEFDINKLEAFKNQAEFSYDYAVFIKLKTRREDCIGYCLEFIEISN